MMRGQSGLFAMPANSRRAPRWQWALAIATAILLPVAFLATCLEGRAGYGPPEILTAADRDWPHEPDVNRRLTDALNRRFPNGTDAGAMQAALLREGFHPRAFAKICATVFDKTRAMAGRSVTTCQDPANANEISYRWDETVCDHFVDVTWTVDARRQLTGIAGRYGDICL
jgi:hypothetical protein